MEFVRTAEEGDQAPVSGSARMLANNVELWQLQRCSQSRKAREIGQMHARAANGLSGEAVRTNGDQRYGYCSHVPRDEGTTTSGLSADYDDTEAFEDI